MYKIFARAALPALIAAAGVAHADDAAVRQAVDAFLGVPAVEGITKVPYGGLYEVVLKSGEVIYTDAQVSFIIDGQIIDGKTRRNITQAKLNELSRINFSELPLKQAIKQVRGNGKRVIATFEDPNCGYCKRLAKELLSLKDVTIYTFMVPILGPDSGDKARNIWCAKDRVASWNDWMVGGKTPANAQCDIAAIDKNAEFARKYRINGTPTIFFADGARAAGFLPADEIEKTLASMSADK